MRYIKSIILIPVMLMALLITGCEDKVENPSFANDEMARIFNWVNAYTTNINDSLVINPAVSPAQGATFKWTIDGVEVASTQRFKYTFKEAVNHDIKFEVTRGGVTNSRSGQIIVIKPFVPKDYNLKMVGFLTRAGTLDDINFNNLTHLVISSAVVGVVEGKASLVDTTFTGMNIPLIVKAAHNAGVYVMMDVTGNMADINGGGLYADYGFYNVIKDVTTRDKAIATIMKYAVDNKLDGINIFLNNTSEGPDALNADVVKSFFNAIPASLPKGPNNKFFYTASVPGGWTTSALAPLATVERIDWVNIQPYRYEDLAPTSHSPTWALNDLAATWHSFGLPMEKIVGGFPAFGLHYHMPTDGTTVTWGNLWMYSNYETYKSILARDATANTKSLLAVDDGMYYDGFDTIHDKAQAVINSGMGGLMMWSIEADTKDPAKSLLKDAYTELGN